MHFCNIASTNAFPDSGGGYGSKSHWISWARCHACHCTVISIVGRWTWWGAAIGDRVGIQTYDTTGLASSGSIVHSETVTTVGLTSMSERISIFGAVANINTSVEGSLKISTNTLTDTRARLIICNETWGAVNCSHTSLCSIVHE